MRRKVSSCLIGLTLFGCGADSSSEYQTSPQRYTSAPQSQSAASPEAPRKTIDALQACVDRHAPGLSLDHYAILFDIETNTNGNVNAVKIKDSMVAGSNLEGCLTSALEEMAVPASAMNTQYGVTPQSRLMVGIVQAAAAPIALLPIVLVAGGVTILIGVTIYVAAESLTEKERCNMVKAGCIQSCTDGFMPSGQPDGMPYHECLRKCLEAKNCWKIFYRPSPGF